MELGLMVKCCLKKDEPEIIEDANGGNQIELADSVNRHQQDEQSQGPVIQWDRILPFRSLKVLLVEDDDSTRHLVSALLRNCSYEVTAVANGLEAWKVLIDLNKQIDLVLTEVVMPYLSGIGLLSKIMNLVPRKNIPVIMMSSDDSMGIVFNCLSKGAVDFLVKPIRKNELKNLWQHVWRKCHSSSGSESDSGAGSGADKPTNARCIEVSDDESDDGSGNQVIYARPDKDNTIKHTGEDNKLDAIAMGKDLAIGAPINSSNVKETRYVLKRSDLSAFSRYNNTTSNANQAPTTNISSCSPTDVNINLETAKQVNTQSKSNGPVNQPSNGSSTLNNDTGSSTIIAALDDGSSRNMVYNGVTEGNYGSASGSNNNTSNGENGNNDETEACDNGVTEKGKSGNMNLSVGGSNDQDRLAQREAALNKFRLKRKERCFEKKVRYQSRKKLAEQRPRVRGQFVRKGKDTDS